MRTYNKHRGEFVEVMRVTTYIGVCYDDHYLILVPKSFKSGGSYASYAEHLDGKGHIVREGTVAGSELN